MIEPSVIKKAYVSMTNAELLEFAKAEGDHLTHDALQILRSEFVARNMPMDLLRKIEDGSHTEEKANVKRITRIVPDQSPSSALGIALNEKRDGHSDDLIVYHLMDQGLDEDQARLVIAQMATEAEQLLKKANMGLVTSVFIFCAGFALHLIAPEKSFITFLDIASTCTMIFAVLKFLKSDYDRVKFKQVIENISAE